MPIQKIMAPFRAVHSWLTKNEMTVEELNKAEEYYEVREELVAVRKELYILERLANTVPPESLEEISLQIKALKERQHTLIKSAKRIYGIKIHIESSLLEHENELLKQSTH